MALQSDRPDPAPASRRGVDARPTSGPSAGTESGRAGDRPERTRRSRFNDVSLFALVGLILAGFLSLAIIALT